MALESLMTKINVFFYIRIDRIISYPKWLLARGITVGLHELPKTTFSPIRFTTICIIIYLPIYFEELLVEYRRHIIIQLLLLVISHHILVLVSNHHGNTFHCP